MTDSGIDFRQIGLGGVLKSNLLKVPPNQREYAWTEDHVDDLFTDLSKAVTDGDDYFLGAIVTVSRGPGTLEVVDGQQRLATTALLLSAIRDYLREVEEDTLVESINNEFLTGIDRGKRDRIPKLTLNVDDHELFRAIVVDSNPTLPENPHPSHERLIAAYSAASVYVRKLVATLDKREHGDYLNTWVSFIEHQAKVVLLTVPNDADAYKMFETLNDRGLRTSQADLVKNFMFGRAESRLAEVQAKWAYMRGALETLDDDDITINFLRHVFVLHRGYISAKEVYETAQQLARTETLAANLASQLEALAGVYVATHNTDHERWNQYPPSVRRAIHVFNLLDIKPMRGLLLAISHSLDAKETAKAFDYLAALSVRLLIATTVRSGSVQEPLALAAKDVFSGEIATADDLKKRLSNLAPGDTQFAEAFQTARVRQARFARYYLRSLETFAQGVEQPWYLPQDDKTILNLEHVLPQNPDGQWDISDDDAKQYAKRIGNLALILASDNSDLKSAPFDEKKKVYENSPFVLTSQLGNYESWGPESISERQKQLAELAIGTWPID